MLLREAQEAADRLVEVTAGLRGGQRLGQGGERLRIDIVGVVHRRGWGLGVGGWGLGGEEGPGAGVVRAGGEEDLEADVLDEVRRAGIPTEELVEDAAGARGVRPVEADIHVVHGVGQRADREADARGLIGALDREAEGILPGDEGAGEAGVVAEDVGDALLEGGRGEQRAAGDRQESGLGRGGGAHGGGHRKEEKGRMLVFRHRGAHSPKGGSFETEGGISVRSGF